MATLGRDCYFKFLLNGDMKVGQRLFINAIRFSTHGDFYCKNTSLNPGQHCHPHFHNFKQHQNIKDFYRVFNFYGNVFSVEPSHFRSKIHIKDDIEFSESIINREYLIYNYIDFLKNKDGTITYICSIDRDFRPIHNPVCINDILTEVPAWFEILPEGTIITLNLVKKSPFFSINTIASHWDLYRAIGINIPLLVVQILLGRKVKTVPLVSLSNVQFKRFTPCYRLNPNAVIWFDLDETLVCRWSPINQTIEVLKNLRKKYKVNLITRHTFDVKETLENIGISHDEFSEIHVIAKQQRKSEFIKEHDVFIDNEFGERVDVRLNSGATVLDIDQIQFL